MYNKYFKGIHTLLEQTKRLEQVIKDPLFQADSLTTFTQSNDPPLIPIDITLESQFASSHRVYVDYAGLGESSTFDETEAKYLDQEYGASTGDKTGCNVGAFADNGFVSVYRVSLENPLDIQMFAFVPLTDVSGVADADFKVTTGMSVSPLYLSQDDPVSDIGGDYTDFALYPVSYYSASELKFISTDHLLYSYEYTDNSSKQLVVVGLNTYMRTPTADSNVFLWVRVA